MDPLDDRGEPAPDRFDGRAAGALQHAREPITSDLTCEEMWNLANMGYMPLKLVMGTAVYSLYATKNITTGEGGMVITNDPAIAQTCASLRHQAYSTKPYVHEAIGYNYRMTDMQAAMGIEQMKKLDGMVSRRRELAARYDAALAEHPWLVAPHVPAYAEPTLNQLHCCGAAL